MEGSLSGGLNSLTLPADICPLFCKVFLHSILCWVSTFLAYFPLQIYSLCCFIAGPSICTPSKAHLQNVLNLLFWVWGSGAPPQFGLLKVLSDAGLLAFADQQVLPFLLINLKNYLSDVGFHIFCEAFVLFGSLGTFLLLILSLFSGELVTRL